MSTETKHTPLPWTIHPLSKRNAAFIVRACNSHDDLVVACEAAKEWCARHRDSSDDQPPMTQLAAALDKAKGRKPFRLACFTYDRTNPTRR